MPSLVIIGAGSWGTTLGIILSRHGLAVGLHSPFSQHNAQMAKQRVNRLFLNHQTFPDKLQIIDDLKQAVCAPIVIIAIPVQYLRSYLKKIKKLNLDLKNTTFVSVSKGIENKSLKTASQIIKQELGPVKIAVLSGPNIAKEVLQGIPSTSIIACSNLKLGQDLQKVFNMPRFRVYYNRDVIGVELGAAIKNIIAIACGISDGLGFGANTKAALVTRGLAEITRLGVALGAKEQTFWGISGLGDLVTTCFSLHSRNRQVGEMVGKGKKISQIVKTMNMVAEGIDTVKSAYALSKRLGVSMPITEQVYKVLHCNKAAKQAVSDLMERPLKSEHK